MKAIIRKSILKSIVIKEFKEVFREKKIRSLLFGAPLMMIIVFGFAVNMDVKDVSMAVMDEDRTQTSREIVRSFTGSGYFVYYADIKSEREIGPLLDSGEIEVLLRIERGLSRKIRAGRSASVQIIIDGANSNRAAVINAYVNEIISTLFFEKLKESIQAKVVRRMVQDPLGTGSQGSSGIQAGRGIELRERSFYNPSLTSRNFFLPGVIVLLVSLVTIMLTSMSIVKERETGTIEQIIVSPIKPYEYILGKTIPFAVIAFIDMVIVVLSSIIFFGVPFNGSFLFIMFSGFIYILSSLSVGLFISTISTTQQQAMLSFFLFFMPAMIFSGFVFPIYSMPESIQAVTLVNPLRYFMTIVRAVFLKGAGFRYLWPELVALLCIGSVLLVLSTRRFKRRLE